MPANLPVADLRAAESAVEFAHATRTFHARRTDKGSKQREDDLRTALERLASAMKPLRRHTAQFSFGPQTNTAEENREAIRKASAALQRERRKLWKMQKR